jgi:hypothetical protein
MPRSPARQGENPFQALPEHLAQSYSRRNDNAVCFYSFGDGVPEYLLTTKSDGMWKIFLAGSMPTVHTFCFIGLVSSRLHDGRLH